MKVEYSVEELTSLLENTFNIKNLIISRNVHFFNENNSKIEEMKVTVIAVKEYNQLTYKDLLNVQEKIIAVLFEEEYTNNCLSIEDLTNGIHFFQDLNNNSFSGEGVLEELKILV